MGWLPTMDVTFYMSGTGLPIAPLLAGAILRHCRQGFRFLPVSRFAAPVASSPVTPCGNDYVTFEEVTS